MGTYVCTHVYVCLYTCTYTYAYKKISIYLLELDPNKINIYN